MNPKKFKNYINGASQMFIEFEKAYYGDEYEQKKNFSMPKPPPKKKKEEKLIQPCFKNNINLNEGITPNIKK